MRLIDADALIKEITEFRCVNCDRRKGMKKGKMTFVYEIGETPCRACDAMDMIDVLDEAPTMDFIRCKDCKHRDPEDRKCDCGGMPWDTQVLPVPDDWYCPNGELNTQ